MKNLHYLNNSFDRVYYFLFFFIYLFFFWHSCVKRDLVHHYCRNRYCNAINRILNENLRNCYEILAVLISLAEHGNTRVFRVYQLFRYAPKWPRMFVDLILQTATITCETPYDHDRPFMNTSIIGRIYIYIECSSGLVYWSLSCCFSWTS